MENIITAFYSHTNLYHFSFTSKILKLNGYDLVRSFSFLHPTQFYESSFLIYRLLTMTLVYSPLIALSLDSHIRVCLIELLLWVEKHMIYCNLSEFWKIRFTFFSATVLSQSSLIFTSVQLFYYLAITIFEPTKYFTMPHSSSLLYLILLKLIGSKFSTIWVQLGIEFGHLFLVHG
jgi:hypothetical protein